MIRKLNNLNYLLRAYPKYFAGLQKGRKFVFDLSFPIVIPEIASDLLLLLKSDKITKIAQLMDLVSIDKLDESKRFQLCYNLLSLLNHFRFIIRAVLSPKVFSVSVSSVFPSANWLERECWDLMGIPFLNHMDLRRILTNYGFDGHPLRKDFPAVGYTQVRYDDESKAVLEEPLTLSQEYRYFDFISPWQFNNNNYTK